MLVSAFKPLVLLLCLLSLGCRPGAPGAAARVSRPQRREHSAAPLRVQAWRHVDELPIPLAQFETVFWDAADSQTLRTYLRQTELPRDKSVLEIGTGTGLIAMCCLELGARRVVATDINPSAVANAAYNAEQLHYGARLEVRQVSSSQPGAFEVVGPDEQFDLIISNPPWEDQPPQRIDDFAFYDQNFALLRSILAGLPRHLRPGGTALLAYGSAAAVRRLEQAAPEYGLAVRRLDQRDLDALPEVFVPGMVLEVSRDSP